MGQGTPAQAVYSASKAALFRIAYSIVRFGHDKGLRIFEVAPGVVETAMTKSMPVHVFRQGDDWTSPEPVTGLALSLGSARTLDNAPDGNEAIEQVWEQTPAVTCHNELDPGTFNATDATRLLRKRLEVHGTQHLPPVPGTDNQPNEFCDRFVHYRPEMARGAYLDEYDSHAEAVEAADRTFTPESISPSAQVEGKAALGDWISHTLVMSR